MKTFWEKTERKKMTADYGVLKDMIFRSFPAPASPGAFKLLQVKPKNNFIVSA
jgi:hypothetical protein